MPREDYRDARDARMREREVHLRDRRRSGEPLRGGRSPLQTTLSSDTGLAETETIALNAVTAITKVSDPDFIVPATSLAAEDLALLAETTVVGAGHLVSIHYTERMGWSGTVTDYCNIQYRLQVIDSDSTVISTLTQYVMECTDGSTALGNIYASPSITIEAELDEGRTYRIQVHTLWHVDSAFDAVGALSSDRVFTITDLKR